MYLEDDLDRAYRIDCKMRTKQDLAWIKRDKFRKVYEEFNALSPRSVTIHLGRLEFEVASIYSDCLSSEIW